MCNIVSHCAGICQNIKIPKEVDWVLGLLRLSGIYITHPLLTNVENLITVILKFVKFHAVCHAFY